MLQKSSRFYYLDLLRFFAILLMFFYHAILMLLQPAARSGILEVVYQLVPICPALFLFVAGFSLTISWGHRGSDKMAYLKHFVGRGAILLAAGSLLFLFEHGIQLPDLLFAPGILYSIGIVVIIMGLSLLSPKPLVTTLTITLLYACITIYLLYNKISIFPLTDGYEPQSPTLIFGMAGTCFGLLDRRLSGTKWNIPVYVTILLLTVITFIILAIPNGVMHLFHSETSRYAIHRTFNTNMHLSTLFSHNFSLWPMYRASVWNYGIISFTASATIVIVLFCSGRLIEPLLQRVQISLLLLPGKFALVNYFFHFVVILMVMNFFGITTLDLLEFLLFMVGLLTASWLLSARMQAVRRLAEG